METLIKKLNKKTAKTQACAAPNYVQHIATPGSMPHTIWIFCLDLPGLARSYLLACPPTMCAAASPVVLRVVLVGFSG